MIIRALTAKANHRPSAGGQDSLLQEFRANRRKDIGIATARLSTVNSTSAALVADTLNQFVDFPQCD
jgi:hypothetical protein